MFSPEVEDTQENCVRRALFGLDDNIVLRAETKIFNIKKKVDRYLKNENNDPCKIYEGFYCGKPCNFIGNKCNNAGLNKVIIDNILTGKRDLDFSLKLTNAIVIELYYYTIKNNYTWKLLRDILLKVSAFNKVIDEKVLCKKIKTLLSIKSSLTAKKKTDDLKIFENTDFIFPDSCVFIANNIESSTISSSNNENEFNAISDSILSWENAELKTELKLSRAEIQTLLSKLSVSNSKVDTLTDCLQEEISEKVIAQERINAFKIELSDLKLGQQLRVQKLGESFQKLNSLSPKNIKRKIC